MAESGDNNTTGAGTTSDTPPGKSGTVDNRDTLKPGQWDRSGAGEIDSGSPSTVGADPSKPGGDNKTSAGT